MMDRTLEADIKTSRGAWRTMGGAAEGKDYFAYWGKARPSRSDSPGDDLHLLAFHFLDVAAAANAILAGNSGLRSRLARLTGLDDDSVLRWSLLFVGGHDVGKFSPGFQGAAPEAAERLQPGFSASAAVARHDSLGDLLWRDALIDTAIEEDLLNLGASVADRLVRLRWREALSHWVAATAGHHGIPPRPLGASGMPLRLEAAFRGRDVASARAFVRDLASILPAGPKPRIVYDATTLAPLAPRASWLIAGLTVLADWIGSDDERFPYRASTMPLAEYWEKHALPQAKEAVRRAGVLPSPGSPARGVSSLFPAIAKPSPVQRWAEAEPAPGVATLYMIEDATGSGKTEAAMALTHRLMASGDGAGFFIGLPTMATANAMFDRILPTVPRLFEGGAIPSVILAHGRREHSRTFQTVALRNEEGELDDVSDQDTEAKAACASWIADSRKKALLAHGGVGTLDQALLGVLPVRHQSLRLLGLAGKVLIVDEVHSYDPYVNRLLEHLVRFHVINGGHVILLSATLPLARRARLVRVYRECMDREPIDLASSAYPLVTVASGDRVAEVPCGSREGTRRSVRVEIHEDASTVADLLAAAARAGRAVCWIRNTVQDALDAHALLTDRLSAEAVTLFHARFALCDRLAIESAVVDAVGKDSTHKTRNTAVVATQVVEQSLDLDFDVMATDLAPMDLIIQRAGRLHRHPRNPNGDPRPHGEDERGPAMLHVLAPPWSDVPREDWYKAQFRGAAHVYPDAGQAWLTLRQLRERGCFSMPDDARALVEAVYGESVFESLPPGLRSVSLEAEGQARADVSQGALSALDPDAGYRHDAGTWGEETRAKTRLSEPTGDVYLARWDGVTLEPWAGADDWETSRVGVRKGLIAKAATATGALAVALGVASDGLPGHGRYGFILPLTSSEDGAWVGVAEDGSGKAVRVRYHRRRGLETGEKAGGWENEIQPHR